MTQMFITRSGRHVPEAATDQAGSEMLVRTVSRYTDGTTIDRPQLCVSPELFGGDIERTQAATEEWDRRSYLPPATPITREELARVWPDQNDKYSRILWDVLGRGLPIVMACERVGWGAGMRRKIQKVIKKIGWGATEQ